MRSNSTAIVPAPGEDDPFTDEQRSEYNKAIVDEAKAKADLVRARARREGALAGIAERENKDSWRGTFNGVYVGMSAFVVMYISYVAFVCMMAGSFVFFTLMRSFESCKKSEKWDSVWTTLFGAIGAYLVTFVYVTITSGISLAVFWNERCYPLADCGFCSPWFYLAVLLVIGAIFYGRRKLMNFVFVTAPTLLGTPLCHSPRKSDKLYKTGKKGLQYVFTWLLLGCILYWIAVAKSAYFNSAVLNSALFKMHQAEEKCLHSCVLNHSKDEEAKQLTLLDISTRSANFTRICKDNWVASEVGEDRLDALELTTQEYLRLRRVLNPFMPNINDPVYDGVRWVQKEVNQQMEALDRDNLCAFLLMWAITGWILRRSSDLKDGYPVFAGLCMMMMLSIGSLIFMKSYCPPGVKSWVGWALNWLASS